MKLLIASAALIVCAPLAQAGIPYTSDVITLRFGVEADPAGSTRVPAAHVDTSLLYRAGGAFDGRYNVAAAGNLAFDAAHAYAGPSTFVPTSSIPASFGFIGAQPGGGAWVLPQNLTGTAVYLGIAADEMTPADAAELDPWNTGDSRAPGSNRWIQTWFRDVRAPAGAEFSLWRAGAGGPTVYVSTAQGGLTANDDRFYLAAQSHDHVNWGFTQPGVYEIDVQLRTFVNFDPLPGDANLDDVVDVTDLGLLASRFRSFGGWGQGDFTGDGVIDVSDLGILAANFRSTRTSFADAAQALGLPAVPEPGNALVLASAATLLTRRRRATVTNL